MGLRPFEYVICIHWATYIITFVLLLTSTILLETSLTRRVSDNAVCSEDDISNHYSKSILTIIVGSIIVFHTILEIGFLFGNPIYINWKEFSAHVKKIYLKRNFQWKVVLSDITFVSTLLIFFCITALPCVLIMTALFDAIGAELSSNGISSLVYQVHPQSDHCCGSSVYTHGLIPNYTTVHPPCLNFMNEILHCRAPNFPKNSLGPPCCCFEPTRVISYLNLAAYNIFIFSLRVLFWTHLGVGGCFMIMAEIDMDLRRQREDYYAGISRGNNLNSTLAHIDINHNEINDSAAYHVISQREPSPAVAQARGVGKFTCAPGQTRDLVKHDILKARQRQSDDLHLAYTFHSCTIEYWMELSLQGVSVKGAHNLHQIDIKDYMSGSQFFDVIRDSFGGYVVLIISRETVKGLLLATGSNASPFPINVEFPTVSDSQIEVRAPRMPLPNIFEDRVFNPGEESQRSLKLGDILIECRLDVYLGAVQTFNEFFSGRHTNIKLGIRNYSKSDSIRNEATSGGRVLIVIRNGECRGVAFIHTPKKVTEHVIISPGKDSTNSDYFISLNFWEK